MQDSTSATFENTKDLIYSNESERRAGVVTGKNTSKPSQTQEMFCILKSDWQLYGFIDTYKFSQVFTWNYYQVLRLNYLKDLLNYPHMHIINRKQQ